MFSPLIVMDKLLPLYKDVKKNHSLSDSKELFIFFTFQCG